MNKLLIIRHGKTDWNNIGLLQGTTDIDLNDDGVKEVNELAKVIDLSKIDFCISSPLKRAVSTAKIICDNKLPIIYDNLLIERCFGNYEGKKIDFDLICKQWNYKINDSTNNIESLQDCLARAKMFIDNLNKKYSNKTILIVSHGSFIKALHFNIIGYNENTDFLSFNPKNATIYEYTIK